MSKGASYAVGLVAVVILAAVGVYVYTTAPTKAPSVSVTPTDTANQRTAANNVMMASGTVVTASETAMVASGTAMTAPVADGKYRFVPERTTATFSMEEDLRGKHITVLGTTNQVTGAVKADPANLAKVEFDPVRINARTFVTDSEQRNNAIRRMILKTENDANEFIEFTVKNVIGAPASSTLSQSFPFKAVGDLKISGVTREVTFDGTVLFNSVNEMSGTAQTKVHYADFGLSVPNLPFLANVDEEVTLKLDFVAKK